MDASLREKTLHAIRRARELFASDKTPPPLPVEKAHRCEGCSLVAICQPEETRMLTGMKTLRRNAASGVTRVMPTRNDGAVLYLQEQGSRVSKQSEHLIVRCEGKEMQKVPMAAVRQVLLFGNVQISTQTLGLLLQQEVDVTILSARGRFIGAVVPAPTKNVTLRAEQYRLFSNAFGRKFQINERCSCGPCDPGAGMSACRAEAIPRRRRRWRDWQIQLNAWKTRKHCWESKGRPLTFTFQIFSR